MFALVLFWTWTSGPAVLDLALACIGDAAGIAIISDAAGSATISDAAGLATIGDEVPCP